MDYDHLLTALAGVWGAGAGALVARGARRGIGTPRAASRVATVTALVTPLVNALATALVCAALAAATGTRPEVAVWLLLAPGAVLLAVVEVRWLPEVLAGAALALLGAVTFVPEHAGRWTTALLGALALGGGHLLLSLLDPGGLRAGEVKLALGAGAVLGWYGWPTVLLGAFAGFLLRASYGAFAGVTRRAGPPGAVVPFGPFLLAGVFLGLLIGAYTA